GRRERRDPRSSATTSTSIESEGQRDQRDRFIEKKILATSLAIVEGRKESRQGATDVDRTMSPLAREQAGICLQPGAVRSILRSGRARGGPCVQSLKAERLKSEVGIYRSVF
ncbi:hypothetical protein HN011_004809, partial [Eciton burchellii]